VLPSRSSRPQTGHGLPIAGESGEVRDRGACRDSQGPSTSPTKRRCRRHAMDLFVSPQSRHPARWRSELQAGCRGTEFRLRPSAWSRRGAWPRHRRVRAREPRLSTTRLHQRDSQGRCGRPPIEKRLVAAELDLTQLNRPTEWLLTMGWQGHSYHDSGPWLLRARRRTTHGFRYGRCATYSTSSRNQNHLPDRA
jgi:hypothetical protein